MRRCDALDALSFFLARRLLWDAGMPIKCARLLSIALIASQLVPAPSYAAAPAARSLSIVVAPVGDGDSDARSVAVSHAIGEALSFSTQHQIADAKLTANIVRYNAPKAGASAAAPDAEALISLAKEHYFAHRHSESKKEFDRAISILESRPGDISANGALLLDAYISRGVLARAYSEDSVARRCMAGAVSLSPDIDLVSEGHPPGLAAVAGEERAKLFARGAGNLTVQSHPEAAEVLINGIRRGYSPLDVELPAGRVRVLLRANRYAEIEREVNVSANSRAVIDEKLSWLDDGGEKSGSASSNDAGSQLREALHIAEVMNADKVLLVDVDAAGGARERITARLFDRALRVSQPPIAVDADSAGDAEALARLAGAVTEQSSVDLAANPDARIDEKGLADPVLLEKKKKPLHKNPVFWGVAGAILAGALGGGIAAAMSGGSGNSGSVKVEFR